MRTTIDLDEDLLRLAKHLSRERQQSLGRVVSDLVRRSLQPATNTSEPGAIPLLPRKPGARPVTTQSVKELLDLDM